MAFGIDDIMGLVTIAGGLGSIFGTSDPNQEQKTISNRMTPEMRLALQRLQELSQEGYSPEALAGMKNQARSAIGNEANALQQSRQQLLRRQGASPVTQQQQLDALSQQRMQAIGSSLSNINMANEQAKFDALQSFANLSGYQTTSTTTGQQDPGSGQGFGQLFGAGLNYFLNGTSGGGAGGSIYEDPAFQKLRMNGQRYQNYAVPNYQMKLPSGSF